MSVFELVRSDERLHCDLLLWMNILNLSRAFGWTPISIGSKQLSLSAIMRNVPEMEVGDDDARSLAFAIRRCFRTLKENQRQTRKQVASLLMFRSRTDSGGAYFSVDIDQLKRVASFCDSGGFRVINNGFARLRTGQ